MIAMEEINSLDQSGFTGQFGRVFESSDWVARTAWTKGPFTSAEDLHRSMIEVVTTSEQSLQIGYLKAHPEIAGRDCQAGEMAQDSTVEQGMDGLNREYGAKHGLHRVHAVRHDTKMGIFPRSTGGAHAIRRPSCKKTSIRSARSPGIAFPPNWRGWARRR